MELYVVPHNQIPRTALHYCTQHTSVHLRQVQLVHGPELECVGLHMKQS